MRLELETTARYRKDIKRVRKQGLDLSLLDAVIQTLLDGKPLDPKYKDHALIGN